MSLEELLALFEANLKTQKVFYPVKDAMPPKPKRKISYTHKLYDLSKLSLLIDELQGLTADEDEDDKYGIRYLVTTEGRIIFAREGRPGQYIPNHKEMNRKCLAAGNVYFNADYSKITRINHESGAFMPSIASLVHALAPLLAKTPQLLDDQIELCIKTSGSLQKITVSKEVLSNLLEKNFSAALAANGDWDKIQIETNIPSMDAFAVKKEHRRALVPKNSNVREHKSSDPSSLHFGAQFLLFKPLPTKEASPNVTNSSELISSRPKSM